MNIIINVHTEYKIFFKKFDLYIFIILLYFFTYIFLYNKDLMKYCEK
jgi:hypothetical protein